MVRRHLLNGLGALGIVSGGIAIWFSFERQMCSTVAGGADSCALNVAYLIPGILAALIGLFLIVRLYRRSQPSNQQKAET